MSSRREGVMAIPPPSARRREVVGWCMFDVANSCYVTTIITVFFGRIFSEVIVGPDTGTVDSYSGANWLWALTLGISWLVTALVGPLAGALSDMGGSRKRFLAASVVVCCIATAGLATVGPGDVRRGALLILISNLGFSLSENFISAFLPHIAPPEKIGRISGLGWGLGYMGGLVAIVLTQRLLDVEGTYSADHFDRLRWLGPFTALLFGVFAVPTFLFVREPAATIGAEQQASWGALARVRSAYRETFRTIRSLRDERRLGRFLTSFFFFQGGVTIVIAFAAIYGAQVMGVTGKYQAIFFVTLQLSAVLGSLFFGVLQDRWGALETVNLTLVIWIVMIVAIYCLEPFGKAFGIADMRWYFIALGNGAGLCIGATQASARAIVGMLAPKERSGEYYGLWGLSGKLAAVFAMIAYGQLQIWMPLQEAMLLCVSFFVVGLAINRRIGHV